MTDSKWWIHRPVQLTNLDVVGMLGMVVILIVAFGLEIYWYKDLRSIAAPYLVTHLGELVGAMLP